MAQQNTNDFTHVPDAKTSRAILSEMGKTGKALAENANVAEEAKEMSRNYTPQPRAIPGISHSALSSVGDPSLPEELRRFNPGSYISPVTEQDYREKYEPVSKFEEWQAEVRAAQQKVLDLEKNDYQWFIRCRLCYGHAVYLTRPIEIGETLGQHDWYARYKPTPESFWDRMPVCQFCLHQGQEVKLDIEVVDQWKRTWRPSQRWIRKLAKDPERFRIEGEHRAVLMPYGASNTHIEDIERRRQLYAAWKKEQAEKAVKSNG